MKLLWNEKQAKVTSKQFSCTIKYQRVYRKTLFKAPSLNQNTPFSLYIECSVNTFSEFVAYTYTINK